MRILSYEKEVTCEHCNCHFAYEPKDVQQIHAFRQNSRGYYPCYRAVVFCPICGNKYYID